MISALFAAAAALGVVLLCTPVVRALALKRGVVDAPGGRRVHQRITPRLGGVGIYFGFFLPLFALSTLETRAAQAAFFGQERMLYGLFLGGTLAVAVGALDDVRGIGPLRKLLGQLAAAAIAYGFGYRIDALQLPGIGMLELGFFAFPVTMAWFLGVTNAINLIDGLDGLAGGIACLACATNIVIAQMNGATVVVLFSACLGGALLGFLRYNFAPASIFMGDSGSMFIGFVLAATSLAGATIKSSTAVAIVAPLVALGVPIFDTMLAMIRRALSGQSIFSADRGHIHHRLLDVGYSQRRVVLTLYGASVLLGLLATVIAFARSLQVGVSIAVGGVMGVVLVRMVRPGKVRSRSQERALHAEDLLGPVRRATVALAKHDRLSAIRRVVSELGGRGGLVRAELRVAGGADGAPPDDSDVLIYEIDCGGMRYLFELTPHADFDVSEPEATTLFNLLADAVREALSRVDPDSAERASAGARDLSH